jgi:hypothetical protein
LVRSRLGADIRPFLFGKASPPQVIEEGFAKPVKNGSQAAVKPFFTGFTD